MHPGKTVTWIGVLVLGVMLALATSGVASAMGAMQPTSREQVPLLSGGIGEHERARMLEQAHHYDFFVSFARHTDGAYVSGVDVVLSGGSLKTPIRVTTSGPLLVAELPTGHYTLRASLSGWKDRVRHFTVTRHQQRALFVTFTREAQTSSVNGRQSARGQG